MKIKSSKVIWFELPADDIERASTFYSDVFGWDLSGMGSESKYAKIAQVQNEGVRQELKK